MTASTNLNPVPTTGHLVLSERKNQLSLAFLQMVAASAGYEVGYWSADYNGIDVTLRSYLDYGHRSDAELDLQLKCTSSDSHIHDDCISYPLESKVYKKLSARNRYQLGALAVLVVPDVDATLWLEQDEERLFARGCMYFSPATSWDPIPNGQDKKIVKCLRSDILDVGRLSSLLYDSSLMVTNFGGVA